MKQWLKIIVTTAPELVESISDFVVGVMGAGVEEGVEDDVHIKTLNIYLEKANLSPAETESAISQLTRYIEDIAGILQVGMPEIQWETIEEEDWGKNWKKHFAPFHITSNFVIVPTWEQYQPAEGEKLIVMDPGMAFGTGHHATTALALQMLEEQIIKSCQQPAVLDVGCGTGILGMAAAMMGAQDVLGIDNDPVAVEAAAENVARNNLGGCMAVSVKPLSAINERYDMVVANIVHDVLADLSNDLQKVTKAGGRLILSGVLHGNQVDSIVGIFAKCGFQLIEERTRDEWAALMLKKKD